MLLATLISQITERDVLIFFGVVISVLLTTLTGLMVYIWNDRKAQYRLDREANAKIFTQLFSDQKDQDEKIGNLERNHASTVMTLQHMEKSDNVLFKLNEKMEHRIRAVEIKLSQ